jgi:hypothetical protein
MNTAKDHLTLLNWNVDGWHHLRMAQRELIRRLQPDVLLLQELTPVSFDLLVEDGWSGSHALLHLPDGHRGKAKDRPVRFSCAVLVGEGLVLEESATDESVPSPERWLTGHISLGSAAVRVGSFAAPPGVTWGTDKRVQGAAIAAWLSGTGSALAGVDRNGPRWEPPGQPPSLWERDAPELFDHAGERGFRDAFFTYLDGHPAELEHIAAIRPDGPLATTYARGRSPNQQHAGRYDAIYVSDDVAVVEVRHVFDEALRAGSDHGLVLARVDAGRTVR